MKNDKEQADLMASEERELVSAAKRGDRSAQKSLYRLYHRRVYNLVYYALDDTSSTEDVTQIVFLKVYSSLNRFRQESTFSTWVYRIALNECLNRNRRRGVSYLPFDEVSGSLDEQDKNPPPDIQHEQNQRQKIIREAVMELSPKLRSVVLLKYVEGLSYEEIAEALQCSTGTVASRLSRALAHLEMRLKPLKAVL